MAVSHIFNGTEYLIPETNDVDWGDQLTALLSDLADNTATLAAAQTFTNKTLVSPIIATITNGGTITIPSGTDTLVGRNTADVLTNKTLTAPAINTPTIANPTINGTVTGAFTLDGAITGGTINAAFNGTIGGTTPAPGAFTGLVASSATVGGEAVVTVGRSIATGSGLTGGGDLSTNRTLSLTGQAAAFHALATDGLVVRSAGTVAARTITGTGNRIVVANGNGTGGNPTIDIGSDVVTVARSITTGTGLAGGGTLAADRTLSLTGQALAVHNLASSGLIARTGADAVAARAIAGTTGRIVVTNGDGVAGNPTIDLGTDVVTVSGAQTITGKTITGASVSGSTITSTTINGLSLPAGAGSAGQFLKSDGAGNVVWGNVTGAEGGTVTSVTAGAGLTGGTITGSGTIALAASGVTAGTYSAPSITVDAYGRITAAATATGASFSDMVWNSHVAGSAFASSWAEMGSVGGGQGWFGSNLYNNGSTWKTRATHASIGARALTFNAPSWGDVSIAEVSGATTAGGTVTPTFRTLWHSGNFNPNLYAGLTANVYVGKQTVIGSGSALPIATGMAAQTNNTGGLEVQSQLTGSDGNTAGAAFLSFHRPANYAVHFGLDTDNKLKVGGWSMGANAYEIWHAGNAPLDANPTGNTVAKRGPDGSLTVTGINVANSGVATARIRDTTTSGGGFAQLILQDDGAPADKRRVSLRTYDSGGFFIGRLNDAEGAFVPWVSADATGKFDFTTAPTVNGQAIGSQVFKTFLPKSTAFTVTTADNGTLFILNPGAATVTIPAANTVPANFMVGFVNNTGSGVVIAGAGVNGASSWGIGAGSFCNLFGDASAWYAEGGGALSLYSWDTSLRNSINLSNNNMTAWRAGYDGSAGSVVANVYKGGTGKFYWEAKAYGDFGTKECGPYLGLSAVGNGGGFQGQNNAVYCRVRQSILSTNQWNQGEIGRGNVYPNDVWGFAWDAAAGLMWVAINNAWIVSGNPALGTNALFTGIPTNIQFRPACGIYNGGGDGVDKYVYVDIRIGAGQWSYAPPPGFGPMV